MNIYTKHRTISVAEAGRIYGKFTPSPLGFIEGEVGRIPMNRAGRRARLHPGKAERKRLVKEVRDKTEYVNGCRVGQD